MMNRVIPLLCLVCLGYGTRAQTILQKLNAVISNTKAVVGFQALYLKNGEALAINEHSLFPMQSVFKVPIAIAVLQQVDAGQLSLQQELSLSSSDLLPNTWSPMRNTGRKTFTLAEILYYTVAESDNNGADILLRLIGGTQVVDDMLYRKHISPMSVVVSEADMHADEQAQYQNSTTAAAANKLLEKILRGEMLGKYATRYLLEIMTQTQTGAHKIKGNLPQGTKVAHKTGSSGINKYGITTAENDIGIITMPDGSMLLIAAFVTNSPATQKENERVIAELSRISYAYFRDR